MYTVHSLSKVIVNMTFFFFFSIDPEERAQFKQGQHDKKFSVFFFKMITESNYSNI